MDSFVIPFVAVNSRIFADTGAFTIQYHGRFNEAERISQWNTCVCVWEREAKRKKCEAS